MSESRDQLTVAREALEFYADAESWRARGHAQIDADTAPVVADKGARARAALAALSAASAAARTALDRAIAAMRSVDVFVNSRERIKQPEGAEWYQAEIAAAEAALASLPTPPAVDDLEQRKAVETRARQIYEGWREQPGWVPWVLGGNSDKQDEARRQARLELA